MNFWQKTKKFYSPALSHPWLCIVAGWVSALIGTSTGYFLIYISKIFWDYFANFSEHTFWNQVYYTMGIFTILLVLTYLLRNFVWIYPEIKMEQGLSKKYFKHFVTSENLIAEKLWTGRIISIMSTGLEKWALLVNESINNIYRWVALLLFSATTLAQTSGELFLWFIILFALIAVNTILFSHYGLYWRMKRKEVSVEQARIETKIIMSKFEILQNKNIEKETEKIYSLFEKIKEYAKKSQVTNVGSWQISRGLISAFMIFICFRFYEQASIDGVSPKLLANFGVNMGLMATFATYFSLLIEYYINFTKDFIHIEKLWETFDKLPLISWYEDGDNYIFKNGDYMFANIYFSYTKNNAILRNLSFKIQWWKKTALVGKSGSGKTTIMKLLAGYMYPSSGKLNIDNQNIEKIRLDSYYTHIGYLTQEPSIFDGSIEENLLYGTRKNPSKKAIEKAIKLAECEFIYELEKWIKTEIGERWVRLSWGQKQRLAIAKIFLKDPEIILLDEPTAALDSYSEEKVARAFEHLFEGRTVIVIAHRLQTVKSADDIIVLEKWKIVERGTHKQLLKLWGKYAGMVDLQSGRVREEDNEEKHEE